MQRFFRERTRRLAIVDHPSWHSDMLSSNWELYENGRLVERALLPSWWRQIIGRRPQRGDGTDWALKLRDLFATLYFARRSRNRWDLYIGVDPLNALTGLFLRSAGVVRKVVYYETDYSPRRYGDSFLSDLYVKLDGFCARHADYVWNISDAVVAARREVGLPPDRLAPQFTVSCGVFPEQIAHLPYAEMERNRLIFSGSFSEANGTDTMLDAMPAIIARVPDAKLTITGTGPDSWVRRIRERIDALGLHGNVDFLGFIEDHRELERIVRAGYVGVAPFRDMPGSTKRYGDVSKLRLYAACGLPVITTSVTASAAEVEQWQAGIVVPDRLDDLAEAVVRMLTDRKLHRKCRNNAVAMAEHNTWDRILEDAVVAMGLARRLQPSPVSNDAVEEVR